MARYTVAGREYCFFQAEVKSLAGESPYEDFEGKIVGYKMSPTNKDIDFILSHNYTASWQCTEE